MLIEDCTEMRKKIMISGFILMAISVVMVAENDKARCGAIAGHISPGDVAVRIIAKKAGTDHMVKKNIKGEVALDKGGNFTIKNLPPGTYDLLFFLKGQAKKKYVASRWSEIVVEPGKTTAGIHYRLTPLGAGQLVDELIVVFKKGVKPEEAQKVFKAAGCTIKDRPVEIGGLLYVVDIPDDKSVAEMIKLFKNDKRVNYSEPNAIATIN